MSLFRFHTVWLALAGILLAGPACGLARAADGLTTAPPANAAEVVLASMKRVADWQLVQPPVHPLDDWTYGALDAGIMALAQLSADPKYHDAMVAMGNQQGWRPGKRMYHADDHCVAQTYLELYAQHRDPAMLGPIKERFDAILANPATNSLVFSPTGLNRWCWCDALFMGPPTWLRLYNATSDKRYLDFMDREWWAASDYLYDKTEHLYFRDSTYFDRREANGKKTFWSRGNGWVLAGLARVLQVMPPEVPHRALYEQQFKEMAAKVAQLQMPDGLWRASLLDPVAYPLPETSGSGFYTFALAWGINRGLLDRATFEPVVHKGWTALLGCVTPAGKLEHVQPIGQDPKTFDPTSSDVFGVGAFLLAGSEVYRLELAELPAAAYATFMPQRKDDFAWENERIAYRVYGPALEATGEISSGIDVWAKRTRKPIVEKWFYAAKYHQDHGEGLDMYNVGPSRGCGGTGIWRDDKVYSANNFVTWRLIENSPARVAFELGYAPYDAAGVKVRETRRISLATGSNLNRIETRFDWEGAPDELTAIVGIVERAGGSEPQAAKDGSWVAYWEPEQPGNGAIGCGVVMSSPAKLLRTKAQGSAQAFLQFPVKRGQTLVYHAGAGWSKSGDFPDKDSWVRYMSDAAAKLTSTPK
jgi:rhamnogalacturonyl hydrolase YesR